MNAIIAESRRTLGQSRKGFDRACIAINIPQPSRPLCSGKFPYRLLRYLDDFMLQQKNRPTDLVKMRSREWMRGDSLLNLKSTAVILHLIALFLDLENSEK